MHLPTVSRCLIKVRRIALIAFLSLTSLDGIATGIDDVVERVFPATSQTWIGWQGGSPGELFLLRPGQAPQSIGKSTITPLATAVARERIVVAGEGGFVVIPLKAPHQIEVRPFAGYWKHIAGNAKGFVASDGARIAFSADGRDWKLSAEEPSDILRLVASADRFAFLSGMTTRSDGQNWAYASISTSNNGLDWESAFSTEPVPDTVPELTELGFQNGRWIAFGRGYAVVSTDALDWRDAPSKDTTLPDTRDALVATSADGWWAVERGLEKIVHSRDGLSWDNDNAHSPENLPDTNFHWIVGPDGLRNIDLDTNGRVVARTFAELSAPPPPAPAAPVAPKSAPVVVATSTTPTATPPLATKPSAKPAQKLAPDLTTRRPLWPPVDPATPPRGGDATALHGLSSAFARDVIAFRKNLNGEPDRAAWDALLLRHKLLLDDPRLDQLHEEHTRMIISRGSLFTASDDPREENWARQMEFMNDALASVATDPELWATRARFLQWDYHFAEARRDAAIAVLLIEIPSSKRSTSAQFVARNVKARQLELSLPDEVLYEEQIAVIDYNLTLAKKNHALGRKPDADEQTLIDNLHINLGLRLQAAWRLPDPADARRAESAVFKLAADQIGNLRYPSPGPYAIESAVDAIWKQHGDDPATAITKLEKLMIIGAHPRSLGSRSTFLIRAGRFEDAANALDGIHLVWPRHPVVDEGYKKLNEAQDAWSLARHAEALAALEGGDTKKGIQILDTIANSRRPALASLLLLAELQALAKEAVRAQDLLVQARRQFSDQPLAFAYVAMAAVEKRDFAEAVSLVYTAGRKFPDDPDLAAVDVLASFLSLGQKNLATPKHLQESIAKLDALAGQHPDSLFVHLVRMQFRAMVRDQAGALADLAEVIRLKPYVPTEQLLQAAQLHRAIGKPEQARAYLEKAAARGDATAKNLLAQP